MAKTVLLINTGASRIDTIGADGKHASLMPGGGQLEVTEKDAEHLLGYAGVIEAAKYVAPGKASEKLRKDNEELKAKIKELEAIIAESDKKSSRK